MSWLAQSLDQEVELDSTVNFDVRFAITRSMLQYVRSRDDILAETELISDQNELLKQIKEKFQNKRSSCFLTESDDAESSFNKGSSLLFRPALTSRKSLIEFPGALTQRTRHSNDMTADTGRFRRRTIPTSEEIEDLMREVHLKCRVDVCDTMSWFIKNMRESSRKVTQDDNNAYQLDKERKAHNIMKHKHAELQKKMIELERRMKFQEENQCTRQQAEKQKKNVMTNLHERQRVIVRSQAALLIKQKLINEDMKRVNTKIVNLDRHEKEQVEERMLLDELWEELLQKIDSGILGSFQNQVYAKCKDNLLKQRKALADEQSDLDKHHSLILKLTQQLHKSDIV